MRNKERTFWSWCVYNRYIKVYNRVPHSWVTETLTMNKVHPKIISFLQQYMVNWNTWLYLEGTLSDEVQIKRAIFQGNSLSAVLFMVVKLPLTWMLCEINCGYYISKEQQPVNHLLYMGDRKLYGGHKSRYRNWWCVEKFDEDIKPPVSLAKCALASVKGAN